MKGRRYYRLYEGDSPKPLHGGKVGEPNLNICFELGYTMALEKDVILVCDEELIGQLPTDVNNFVCGTYPRGDYETLKDELSKVFRENYRVDLTITDRNP